MKWNGHMLRGIKTKWPFEMGFGLNIFWKEEQTPAGREDKGQGTKRMDTSFQLRKEQPSVWSDQKSTGICWLKKQILRRPFTDKPQSALEDGPRRMLQANFHSFFRSVHSQTGSPIQRTSRS